MELPENTMELLAAIEHERWADWQKFLHSCCVQHEIRSVNAKTGILEYIKTGSLIIPRELVERWERQIATEYKDLTEKEKESDRDQVKRYLPILRNL